MVWLGNVLSRCLLIQCLDWHGFSYPHFQPRQTWRHVIGLMLFLFPFPFFLMLFKYKATTAKHSFRYLHGLALSSQWSAVYLFNWPLMAHCSSQASHHIQLAPISMHWGQTAHPAWQDLTLPPLREPQPKTGNVHAGKGRASSLSERCRLSHPWGQSVGVIRRSWDFTEGQNLLILSNQWWLQWFDNGTLTCLLLADISSLLETTQKSH